MAGYSPKALWEKLGVKSGMTVVIRNHTGLAIPDYLAQAPFPVTIVHEFFPQAPFNHLFVDRLDILKTEVLAILPLIDQAEMLWISWPKRASGIATDITEDRIRDVILPLGLVDVKVCSVTDEVWSGLKTVIRKTNRRQ